MQRTARTTWKHILGIGEGMTNQGQDHVRPGVRYEQHLRYYGARPRSTDLMSRNRDTKRYRLADYILRYPLASAREQPYPMAEQMTWLGSSFP